MALLNSKSPRTNYATRLDEAKPNIAHPNPDGGGLSKAGEAVRAVAELTEDETGTPVVATFPTSR